VMLRLAQKAFFPGRIPFPLLHVDTSYKFPEMIEFRDRYTRELGAELIVHQNREALQALERSGIVEIVHGERARVVVPTADRLIAQIAGGALHLLRTQPDMLEHLKHARLFLETGTARMAAERATEEDVARLQLSVAQHRASMVNLEEFIERDMAFHREIASISGNPIFPSIVESLFRWAGEYYRPLVRAPGAEELTLAEHQRIVDAIAKRDGDAAAEAMHAHLSRANELYRKLSK